MSPSNVEEQPSVLVEYEPPRPKWYHMQNLNQSKRHRYAEKYRNQSRNYKGLLLQTPFWFERLRMRTGLVTRTLPSRISPDRHCVVPIINSMPRAGVS